MRREKTLAMPPALPTPDVVKLLHQLGVGGRSILVESLAELEELNNRILRTKSLAHKMRPSCDLLLTTRKRKPTLR